MSTRSQRRLGRVVDQIRTQDQADNVKAAEEHAAKLKEAKPVEPVSRTHTQYFENCVDGNAIEQPSYQEQVDGRFAIPDAAAAVAETEAREKEVRHVRDNPPPPTVAEAKASSERYKGYRAGPAPTPVPVRIVEPEVSA